MTRQAPDRDPRAAGAARARQGLSGFWTGVFDTEDARYEATPFHVVFCEEGGLLIGEAVEPNLFSPEHVAELFASLEGWRDGAEIEFVKTYEDAIGAGYSVRFEGAITDQGARIIGVWRRLGGAAEGGPFVMNRADGVTVDTAGRRR